MDVDYVHVVYKKYLERGCLRLRKMKLIQN